MQTPTAPACTFHHPSFTHACCPSLNVPRCTRCSRQEFRLSTDARLGKAPSLREREDAALAALGNTIKGRFDGAGYADAFTSSLRSSTSLRASATFSPRASLSGPLAAGSMRRSMAPSPRSPSSSGAHALRRSTHSLSLAAAASNAASGRLVRTPSAASSPIASPLSRAPTASVPARSPLAAAAVAATAASAPAPIVSSSTGASNAALAGVLAGALEAAAAASPRTRSGRRTTCEAEEVALGGSLGSVGSPRPLGAAF